MEKKQAKFFCENCGAEVSQNSRFCKKCGRFFASVRCPSCGKTGPSNMFTKGCPSCGYANKGEKNGGFITEPNSKNQESHASNIAKQKGYFFFHKKHTDQQKNSIFNPASENSLPLWIYVLTFVILVIVIFMVMRCAY